MLELEHMTDTELRVAYVEAARRRPFDPAHYLDVCAELHRRGYWLNTAGNFWQKPNERNRYEHG